MNKVLGPLIHPALVVAVAFAASCSVATWTTPALAQSDPPDYKPPDDAAALFKQGNDAYRMKRWEEAYQSFWRAFDLKKSYDIAGNLGDVELILGKHRDAAEHLDFSLRNWPAGQQAARKRTLERFDAAKAEVGILNVKVDVDGAEIAVNGKSAGTSPIQQPLFVDPGAVTVDAKHGDQSVSRTIAFDKGQERTLELTLGKGNATATVTEEKGAPPAPKGADAPATSSSAASADASVTADSGSAGGSSLKTIGLITSGAVALVGAGVGVGFLMAKSSAKDDAAALRSDNNLGSTGCSAAPRPAACSDLADANDRAKRDSTLSTIGFIGAGVGVAGVVTFLLLPDQHKSGTAVAPIFDRRTVGLTASGSF